MAIRNRPGGIVEDDAPQISVANPGPISLTPRQRLMRDIMADMISPGNYRFLIKGDTGLGKTTMVELLAKLLGMNLELLEIPHATEEHLIQLPFVVFKATGGEDHGRISVKKNKDSGVDDVDIELARSHLSAKLRGFSPLPDDQYIAQQLKWSESDKQAYRAIGGEIGKISPKIKLARSRWHSIMFFDEYWRQTTPQIRNVLRDILNGMIGNDQFPEKVYVVYASNMQDQPGTIEEPSQNARMRAAEMPAPTAKELVDYLKGRHNLKPAVVAAVQAELKDEHMSHNDEDAMVRTSPRRWEQVLLYINANVPPANRNDAAALLANLKHMFSNQENESSELWPLVEKIARRIIKDSGSSFHDVKSAGLGDWRQILDQQIATKMKIGSARKYVPVISGSPGIAKTAAMREIADKNNLVLIHISSPTLDSDSISGLPIPRRQRNVTEAETLPDTQDRLGVAFAEPVLYKSIMQRAEDATKEFLADKSPEEVKKWQTQTPYKYLLFFDEINRVKDNRTFNALRRVLLDKKFGDGRKVPDDMLIVAAMNPTDSKTLKLTSHVKDAIDIIGAVPSWKETKDWIQNHSDRRNAKNIGHISDDLRGLAKKVVIEFAETFGQRFVDPDSPTASSDTRQFHVSIGPGQAIYVSPRDYDDLYKNIAAQLFNDLDLISNDEDERNRQLADIIYRAMHYQFDLILRHAKIDDAPEFMSSLKQWLEDSITQWLGESSHTATMDQMLMAALKPGARHLAEDPNFINYIREFDRTEYEEQLTLLMDQLIEQEVNKYDLWAKEQSDARRREQGKTIVVNELWTKVQRLHTEVVDAAKEHDLQKGEWVDGFDTVLERTLAKIAKQVKLPEELRSQMVRKGVDMLHKLEVADGR